jgi:uncharacterized protein YegP (UPF0339 family)
MARRAAAPFIASGIELWFPLPLPRRALNYDHDIIAGDNEYVFFLDHDNEYVILQSRILDTFSSRASSRKALQNTDVNFTHADREMMNR